MFARCQNLICRIGKADSDIGQTVEKNTLFLQREPGVTACPALTRLRKKPASAEAGFYR
ncbi:hypothetical protein D1AOALGA4SA_3684 [Olavius algarvensis Delta 1 endosymbiont]|nr:hypothetical protein D1AOALGA4SA_3684 [Olavius algarvensis Delta 1 endosymbiont]